jgi:hypothetical protein
MASAERCASCGAGVRRGCGSAARRVHVARPTSVLDCRGGHLYTWRRGQERGVVRPSRHCGGSPSLVDARMEQSRVPDSCCGRAVVWPRDVPDHPPRQIPFADRCRREYDRDAPRDALRQRAASPLIIAIEFLSVADQVNRSSEYNLRDTQPSSTAGAGRDRQNRFPTPRFWRQTSRLAIKTKGFRPNSSGTSFE